MQRVKAGYQLLKIICSKPLFYTHNKFEMIYKIILVQKHKDISASTFLGRITCLLTKAVTF